MTLAQAFSCTTGTHIRVVKSAMLNMVSVSSNDSPDMVRCDPDAFIAGLLKLENVSSVTLGDGLGTETLIRRVAGLARRDGFALIIEEQS